MRQFLMLSLMIIASVGYTHGNDDEVPIRDYFGVERRDSNWNNSSDFNQDGIVDGVDLSLLLLGPHVDLSSLEYSRDHVLVRFRSELSERIIEPILCRYGSRLLPRKHPLRTGFQRVSVPVDDSVEGFLERLQKEPAVVDVQFNFVCRKLETPDDPFFKFQWHFEIINVPEAWDLVGGGSEKVTVAVVDTGVAYEDYQDFQKAPDLQTTRFVHPYDFINSDDHANDDEGHGTHVTGTIAQSTNNGIGVAGIAFNCAIMPLKILDRNGIGYADDLSEAIRWAVDKGAGVINLSLGFGQKYDGGAVVREAIQYAYSKDVICVAAAGNNGDSQDYSGGLDYPAAFAQCISVGALDVQKNITYYSSWGTGLTCTAPGGDLRYDLNLDGRPDGIYQQSFSRYGYNSFKFVMSQGTSNATPHVAAAAALFKSQGGGGMEEFRTLLQETCVDLGSMGYDTTYGYGMIDVAEIVRYGQGWGVNN